jgi:hypothetical protein
MGAALSAKNVGTTLGFETLSPGLFGVGALLSVAVGFVVGAVILWSVKRAAIARGSDRVMEEQERARCLLSMAVAGLSLVWVWRGMVP